MKRGATRVARQAVKASREIPAPLSIPPRPAFASSSRTFSTCRPVKAAEQQQQQQSKAKEEGPQQEESKQQFTQGTSPFTIFVQVIREEIEKNRQLQDNLKQLGGQVSSVQDSKTWSAMRAAGERAKLAASIQENPRIKKAAEDLIRTGGKVNDAIAEAVTQSLVYRGLSKGAQAMYDASEPIRQTEMYKQVAESVGDVLSDVKYGGYVEKDARRRRREARLKTIGKDQKDGLAARAKAKVAKMDANLEAGENIILHPTAAIDPDAVEPSTQSLLSRILPTPLYSRLSSYSAAYEESDNPFVSTLRSMTKTVGRVFDETETARVVKGFKELDPTFQQEVFLKELRDYIVPEVVDALVNADIPTLRHWLSEAPLSVISAQFLSHVKAGLISDSRVLDIRGVDLVKAQVLENEVPVFVIAFHTQEMHAFRDPKTGSVVVGADDRIKQCSYVVVMTRLEEELDNEETGGWKIIDMARRESP